MVKYPKTQLVIVAEAVLERPLIRDARQRGAQSCTVSEVHGVWHEGGREGVWEADRTIELKVICEPEVADAIAEHVLQAYAGHYGVSITFSEVSVLRPERY